MKYILTTAASILLLGLAPFRASATAITVPGRANPWLVDATTATGGDTAPEESPVIVNLVDVVEGDELTFSVTGSVNYAGGPPTDTPDGNLTGFRSLFHLYDATNGGPENGLAGLNAPANALVGVLVGPTIPVPGPTPQPFLNFAPDGNVPDSIDYTSLAPELNQPFFIGDGMNASGMTQHVVVPTGSTRLVLGSMDGAGWYDNTGSFSVEIGGNGEPAPTPTPPPHGGLSATQFTVDEAAVNPTGEGKDTVLRFAAVQTGNPAGLKVRVQASATPNTESSWVDLPNGSGGYMTRDETTGLFVLNSLNYPLQNGMHFRAISSAPNYADSISNVVGYYDLATSVAHVVPVELFLATNGPGQKISFRAKLTSALSGTTLRVQATTTPSDESSWADLADGNGGAMFPYDDPTLFYLNTTQYPAGAAVYFRAVATHAGRKDSISNFVGVHDAVVGPTPDVEVVPISAPQSGQDGTADDPLVYSIGTITFGAQFFSGGTVTEIGLIYDGTLLEKRTGGTSFQLPYITSVGGDHVVSAYAVNSLGIRGYSQPLHIRIKPPTGKVFTRVGTGGNWSDASKWHDANGATGIPGLNDIAVLGSASVSITQNVSAYGVSLNGGTITGAGGGLTVSQSFAINGGMLKNLNTTITSTGTVVMSSDTDVPMSGSWTNYGSFKLNGRGGIVPVPTTGSSRALGAPQPNGFFDGVRTFFANIGQFFVDRLSTPPPAPTPPPTIPPPVEPPRSIVLESLTTKTKLIGPYGAGLISPNGGTLIAPNGTTIISNDGASLISNDGGSLITNDGGSLITNDGGSIISNDGASLITNDGGSFQGKTSVTPGAPAPAGFVQAGGETDLSGLVLISNISLEGGVLSGSGAIAGNLVNSGGYLSPGHSPGAISVIGDFIQGADGTLIVENGGPAPNEFDQLNVTGTATLGGNLDVKLIDGYTPAPDDTFSPIAAGAVSGNFASVSANGQAAVTADGVLLSTDPAIPSPQSGKPLNISTRMDVLQDDNVLIAGFIITGPEGATKKVLIRGLGPSLPVPGALADPVLELHASDGSVITNDNWKSDQRAEIEATTIPPTNDLESALVATLPVGAHTAIVRGKQDGTGIGLVEVYDLEGASTDVKLANISTRGRVETGDNVMIGGFIIGGSEPARILVRALGPSLTDAGVADALQDPVLELHDANGSSITNDNWRADQALEIIDSTIPPTKDAESAVSATLVPGNYTAVVRGNGDTTGVALVEVYNLQ